MNKGELISLMAEGKGDSKTEAEKALNWVTNSIIDAISKGYDINLIGFGSFQIQKRAEREGRNPKTGEKMHIKAYNQPVFKAGKKIKDACN